LSVQIFMASCDLVAAALGVCGCSGSIGDELEYQICAVKQIESSKSKVSVEKPKRLCRYPDAHRYRNLYRGWPKTVHWG
jgi:hypothetical protein